MAVAAVHFARALVHWRGDQLDAEPVGHGLYDKFGRGRDHDIVRPVLRAVPRGDPTLVLVPIDLQNGVDIVDAAHKAEYVLLELFLGDEI